MERFIALLAGLLGSTAVLASESAAKSLDLTASWVGYTAMVILLWRISW